MQDMTDITNRHSPSRKVRNLLKGLYIRDDSRL
jgi:hypothetical protein